jgi:hypothetical protein
MVATEDIGNLAAKTLQQEWQGNRDLELEGPHRYSAVDTATAFSRHLDRPVRARSVPRSEWAAVFEKQGMPADRTAPRIEMLDGLNSDWIDFERTGTEHITGKPNHGSVLPPSAPESGLIIALQIRVSERGSVSPLVLVGSIPHGGWSSSPVLFSYESYFKMVSGETVGGIDRGRCALHRVLFLGRGRSRSR